MAEKDKKPSPPPSPADDLIPRSMLPDTSVIPEWRQFGYDAESAPKKAEKPKKPVKKASGGGVKKFGPRYGFKRFAQGGSASKRADGCAVKGKTRGKFV